MWRTRVGYAGGSTPEPTYRAIADHTEVFQVDFDPDVMSYEDLLGLVWLSHDPTVRAPKRQYDSLILAHDDTQLALARESAERMAHTLSRPLATRIERLGTFWLAEEYHQKYHWKRFAREWQAVSDLPVPDFRTWEFSRWLETGAVPQRASV